MPHGRTRALFTRLGVVLALIALTAGLAGEAVAQVTRLSVYTALENDQLGYYESQFEADNRDIDIGWVRDSTGIITARLLAEKDNPRADIIWGLAVSSLLIMDDLNLLQPYTPRGAEQLKAQFRDNRSPMRWTGMDAFLSVICYNTVEAKRRGLRAPFSWVDLLNPAYRGRIVMPNPASSGTGFLTVSAWLQMLGEEKGWDYVQKLNENIGYYTHSGSAPCVRAAQGEFALGIGFDARGALLKLQGFPIEVIIPKEGAGWDMEATGIMRGTRNLAAAQRLADWSVGRKANEMYNGVGGPDRTSYAVVAFPGLTNVPPFYPPNAERQMFKQDFGWMAKNRDRILGEWAKRTTGKSTR